LNNNRNNRRRGRGNRSQGGNGNQLNRIDSRARGNAPQLLEKYKKLAQDAHHNGDRVQMEYYLQFADHYFRVIADNKARQDEQRGPGGNARRNDERDQTEDFGDDDTDFGSGRRNERSQRPRRDDRDLEPRGIEEGDYGQEGESFLSGDDSETSGDTDTDSDFDFRPEPRSEPRSEPRGEPRRRQQQPRRQREDAPAAERSERGEKSETRRRKPRKSGGEDRAGIDSSILPPSIRGDDSGSGESGGALETVD
jgi:hypothetical protein